MKEKLKRCEASNIPWCMMGWLFLVSFVLGVFYITRPVPSAAFRLIINLIAILYPILLACCCFRGSRKLLGHGSRKLVSSSSRRFSLVLLGMVLLWFALAEFVWFCDSVLLGHTPHFPSIQHFLFLGMYPFYICAFLCLPSRNLSRFARLSVLFDTLIIMTVVTTLCYYFLLAPLLMHGEGTILEKSLASIFTVADLVLLFCLLLVALRCGEAALHPVLILLALGILGLFATDAIHLSEVLSSGYDQFSLGNTFLLLAGVFIAGAAQTIRRLLVKGESGEQRSVSSIEQTALLYPAERLKALAPSLLVLAFNFLILGIYLTGGNKSFAGQIKIIYLGGFITLFLMIVRQVLTMFSVNTLQEELQNKNCSLHGLNEYLARQSATDPLTGLPNHRAVVERLDEELRRAQRKGRPCALLFIDLDYFKAANDRYGHLVGDTILRQFGELIRSNLRSSDYLGRWGGEEFVAILPELGTDEASQVAIRLRAAVAAGVFAGGEARLTCSLGVASYPADATGHESLIACADHAMYMAKRLGRNQVWMAGEPIAQISETLEETPESEEEIPASAGVLHSLVEARDRSTSRRASRVAVFSRRLALALGLSETEAHMIGVGGLLHNLGMIALPDAVLFKQEFARGDEAGELVSHPETGAKILAPIPVLQPVVAIVRSHHERVDGSGYPDGLVGEAIPLGARIVALVARYDELTTGGAEGPTLSASEALNELQRGAGSQFDPHVVDALTRLLAVNRQIKVF